MSITIDGSAFRASLLELGESVHQAAMQALTDGVDAAAKDAFSTNLYRNHTWTLRSSTKATVNRFNFTAKLTNSTKYASFIENGTAPHVIAARNAPNLRFYWTRHGRWFTGKKVNHPGTAARPFFQHAGQVGGSVIEAELHNTVDHLTQRFNRAA